MNDLPLIRARRLPKSEWHWLCRVIGHNYEKVAGSYARFTPTCTRCGFDPRVAP